MSPFSYKYRCLDLGVGKILQRLSMPWGNVYPVTMATRDA